ncbi:hypothetical protein PH552_30565 [Rhizobium sp. CNPSo 3968]|uniref:hypothetical protein n=1 Tax=Rhizobium sp. CNPSo 3968 TaxID=3021408 RepID=UPI0013AE9270|nr:hypothetical protein [Rhizobium sp. CNPSo 3968]MDK4723700.1 hypothetical protein [Rhizobium sp. CNPSo 3968]
MVDRIIAGTINSDGSVKYGSGFSVSRPSEGHFMISFRPAFSQINGASATEIYDGDTRDNAVIISLSTTDLYVKVGDSHGDAKNRDFTFIASGIGEVTAAKTS